MSHLPTIRVGFGYDVHRFDAQRPLVLGGHTLPEGPGLLGHSDADVLLHALTDALLGSLALRDIGYHFPDTDPKYKGADSTKLLKAAYELVRKKGWLFGNADCTLIAEAPKLNPHIPQMQTNIADILDCEPDAVSIKATTHEKMGALGRLEGMAAHATVLVFRPHQ